MVTFLAKIFIKNPSDYHSREVRQAYGMLCGTVGILLNILLFAGKWLAGTLSGSIAITADAFNNLSDAGSSVITLLGFKLSGQKPDPEHPFGHGRMEYISGLFVAVAILIMGFELVKTSISKVLHPESIESSPLILGILIASILVKFYMNYYNRKIGRKIESTAMIATANDSLSDTISTILVLGATLISQFTGLLLDGWFGIAVGLFIVYTGITTMKDTMDPLLGQPPSSDFVKEIEDLVKAHPIVCGIHDLLVHDYGPGRLIISLHAEVPAHGNLLEIHDEIDNIEKELQDKLFCTATIHMDPIVTNDARINGLKDKVTALVQEIEPGLDIHDFRVVEGNTHANIIFDIVIPYKSEISDQEILSRVKSSIRSWDNGKYFAVIQVDHDYA